MTRSLRTDQFWLTRLLSLALFALPTTSVFAQSSAGESRLAEATDVLNYFTADDDHSIPTELLERARGIAIVPGLVRGGFILGGRRGKGVLVVRSESGQWSNPAFISLTGGSIGWQIGVESVDLILIFANDRSVQNIANGKFTIGGDASAVAGPVGRHNTAAVTFKSEVYAYLRSRGLFAGAALEGTRFGLDKPANWAFYPTGDGAQALGVQSTATPGPARRFLLRVEQTASSRGPVTNTDDAQTQEAVTYPLTGSAPFDAP